MECERNDEVWGFDPETRRFLTVISLSQPYLVRAIELITRYTIGIMGDVENALQD